MTDDKKKAAAIAAVMSYLQEEEALGMQSAMAGMLQAPAAAAASAAGLSNPWGVSGRQAQMQLRQLMQLRTFQRN
ncbi:MAG: hypothetical protein QNL14_17765 [Deltaproteobacteria bacterium]|nr:hypothetical protein [Deltaproteobacteria bacterium]